VKVCQIGDQDTKHFAKALSLNCTLEFNQLENNLITDLGGDALFQTCLYNKSLHVAVKGSTISDTTRMKINYGID